MRQEHSASWAFPSGGNGSESWQHGQQQQQQDSSAGPGLSQEGMARGGIKRKHPITSDIVILNAFVLICTACMVILKVIFSFCESYHKYDKSCPVYLTMPSGL
jgi:hypothetical protein